MKYKNIVLKKVLLLCAVFITVGLIGRLNVKAAGSVAVTEVNYEKSTVTVQMAAGDSILFISDDKQKKWDIVPIEKNASNQIVFDISWVSTSKNYTISFKGDVSDTPIKVVIPKQVTNFKATYSALKGGSISFSNDSGRKIQWKKKEALRWTDFPQSADAFSDTLYSLCSNGAVLSFRLAPVNGNGTNPGLRPSKEVLVSVKKKTAAPTVKLDDAKMALYVVKGMEYRYCDENGNPLNGNAEWTKVEKTEYVSLSNMAGKSLYDKTNNPVPQNTYMQFRTAATSSAQVSNIATIKIPAQTNMPSDITDKAKIEYASKTSFKISVNVASSTSPYEYCIINQDDIKDGIKITDFNKVTWKPINSSSAITVTQTDDKVKDGSLVYIRKKAYKSLGDEEYSIASPWILLGTVCYPGDISTGDGKLTCLTTTVGVCNEDNSEGNLTFTMYSPVSSKIKTLKFYKSDLSSQVGSTLNLNEDFRCSVSLNPSNGGDNDKKYIVTTTIYSTAKLDSAISSNENNVLLAKIKLEDSTTEFVSSTDNGGVELIIHPKTVVNNPGTSSAKANVATELAKAGNSSWSTYNPDKDFASFTTSFTRLYLSNRICPSNTTPNASIHDPHQFRVKLDIGTRYIPDKTSEGGFTTNKVEVTKIKYDGVEMNAGTYFTVDYADITDDNKPSWQKRMAVITFNVNEIEKNSAVTARDVEKPVVIYLSNGEVIKDVKLKLQSTATLKDSTMAISFIKGSIPEKETTTTTVDGKTSTTEKSLPDKYQVEFNIFDKNYNVVCTRASWNGHDVLSGVSTDNGVLTVTLSNSKLNSINVGSTITGPLKFTFDNGFVTESGCRLTIIANN